jgi:hypothetical protein
MTIACWRLPDMFGGVPPERYTIDFIEGFQRHGRWARAASRFRIESAAEASAALILAAPDPGAPSFPVSEAVCPRGLLPAAFPAS